MSWAHLITIFISLFVVANPIGSVPIFLSLTKGYESRQRTRAAIQAAVAAFIILVIITWVGTPLLHFFGISLSAFRIAGGIIVFAIGFSMLNSRTSSMHHTNSEHRQAQQRQGNIAVVPMAMPIMSGPGTMSLLIVATHDYAALIDKVELSGLVLVLSVVIALFLMGSTIVSRLVGPSGIKILTRIMGMVLMSIAVTMIVTGVGTVFPGLIHP